MNGDHQQRKLSVRSAAVGPAMAARGMGHWPVGHIPPSRRPTASSRCRTLWSSHHSPTKD